MISDRTDPVAWAMLADELSDAVEHLQALVREMQEDADFGEPEFRIGLGHVYAHLNRAWNCRDVPDAEIAAMTQEQFERWSQMPADLEPT